nr:MAG: capsid protein [Cressdnaviricota sp.]
MLTYAKKTYNKAKKVVKKRYFSGKGYSKPKMVQMAKDVSMLKGLVNAEKKRYIINSTTPLLVAQLNGNSSGNAILDVTPIPTEGVTYSTRNGASIKLHSALFRFQIYQQVNRISPMKLKFYLFYVKGLPQSTGSMNLLVANPFISGAINDYNSNRNVDFFGEYQIIKTWTVSLKDENVANDTTIKEIQIPIKFNKGKGHHIRFNGDNNSVANGQIALFMVGDSGNISAVTVSTITPVPITGLLTGCNINYNFTYYYYDN